MTDPARDAFGRLLIDPARLDFRSRVDCLRWLSGHLQAERDLEAQWLGSALRTWLDHGGDLIALLGIRPARGSRVTAQAIVREALHDVELLRAAVEAGSARAAATLIAAGPHSPAAFSRAKKRRQFSRHRA